MQRWEKVAQAVTFSGPGMHGRVELRRRTQVLKPTRRKASTIPPPMQVGQKRFLRKASTKGHSLDEHCLCTGWYPLSIPTQRCGQEERGKGFSSAQKRLPKIDNDPWILLFSFLQAAQKNKRFHQDKKRGINDQSQLCRGTKNWPPKRWARAHINPPSSQSMTPGLTPLPLLPRRWGSALGTLENAFLDVRHLRSVWRVCFEILILSQEHSCRSEKPFLRRH